MKNLFYFSLFHLLVLQSLTGQELLSNVVSGSHNVIHFAETVNDENYIIKIFHDDQINAYKLISKDSILLISSNTIVGIAHHQDVGIIGKYIYYSINKRIGAYNYIENTITENDIGEEYRFSYWHLPEAKDILYSVYSPSAEERFYLLFDFEEGIKDIGLQQRGIVKRCKEQMVFRDYSIDYSSYSVVLYDYKINRLDTLFSRDRTINQSVEIDDDGVWYIDDEGRLKRFDYHNTQTTVYGYISEPFNSNWLLRNDSLIYIFNSKSKDLRIQTYNLITNKKSSAKDFSFSSGVNEDKFIVRDKNLICVTEDNSYIAVFTPELDYYQYFLSYVESVDDIKILDNRYILSNYSNRIDLIDLNTLEYESIFEVPNNEFIYLEYLVSEDDFSLLNMYSYLYDHSKLYYFDHDTKELVSADALQFTNSGLVVDAELMQFNNEIMVLEEDIYRLYDDSLLQVNNMQIYDNIMGKYFIDEDKVIFLEAMNGGGYAHDIKIWQFDGNILEEIVYLSTDQFPYGLSYFWDVIMIEDYLYLSAPVDDLYKYYLPDSSVSRVNISPVIPSSTPSMFKEQNDLYYMSWLGLTMIREHGMAEIIDTSYGYHHEPKIFKYKERLFYLGDNVFYEISNGSLTELYSYDFLSNLNFKSYRAEENDDMVITLNKNLSIHFDGDTIYEIQHGSDGNFRGDIGLSMISSRYSFYDCEKKINKELPIIPDMEVIRFFKTKNDSFLIARSNYFNDRDYIEIYKCENYFDSLTPIKRFDNLDMFAKPKVYHNGKTGMIYCSSLLIKINSEDEFLLMNGIEGVYHGYSTAPQLLERDGYVYFLATAPYTGKQLYRLKLETTELDEISKNFASQLSVYPNPASDYIIIDESIDINQVYLFSVNGQETEMIKLENNSYNISELQDGSYFLIVTDSKEKIYSGKFIKVK